MAEAGMTAAYYHDYCSMKDLKLMAYVIIFNLEGCKKPTISCRNSTANEREKKLISGPPCRPSQRRDLCRSTSESTGAIAANPKFAGPQESPASTL
jgi:hypothetical protein